ncbi:NucA/NucB deoxyribonuclease domain-containing protein [Cellulomonas bogoriensis]|nr:NucA/NucB deoxyribonuclease domain-containing protein [Cellulomonas bogoriensis]
MEWYAAFDGGNRFTGVTERALAGWGWRPTANKYVEITIENDGRAWRATAQDVRAGAREFTYTSATPVNGVSRGSVQLSSPQPPANPPTAGVTIIDVADAIDIDALARALVAAGVSTRAVCEASLAAQGTHLARSTVPDHVLACEAAAAAPNATMRTVLAALMRAGGAVAVQLVALEFVGTGAQPTTPPWVGDPDGPPTPRPTPPSLPDDIWKVVPKAERFARVNQVSPEHARTAVERCLTQLTYAGLDAHKRCDDAPTFYGGRSDTPEATQHDAEAISRHPQWSQLNRKEPANSRDWLRDAPECDGNSREIHCDEFPFASTRQGGASASPPVSLKLISRADNAAQGSKLAMFYATCGISDGDTFLVVPLPEVPGIPRESQAPTLAVCNGR